MCLIVETWMHLSYRLGRKAGYPPGSEFVPFVVYALSLAGASGLVITVKAHCVEEGPRFLDAGKRKSESWEETFYCPPGYFRDTESNLGVREEGLQSKSSYRWRGIVKDDYAGDRTTLSFEIEVKGAFREDEEDYPQLQNLLYFDYKNDVEVFFRTIEEAS